MWKILISIPLVTEAQNVFLAVDYASKWDQENVSINREKEDF
jgi:hypothetical protein